VFAQGDIFLYKHATIVAFCLPLNCAFFGVFERFSHAQL
jgi:hypothetical protein